MSNATLNSGGGDPPDNPKIPTSFTTDTGVPAIPASNNLNVFGDDTTDDNTNGIQTFGAADTVTIQLTNRFYATNTSVNGAVLDLITFDLGASAAVYRFEFKIAGRDTASVSGVGYEVLATAKTDGATATVIATPFIDADEDTLPVDLTTANIDFIDSGNNVILQVTGVVGVDVIYAVDGSYVVV